MRIRGLWHGFLVIALLALAVALFGPVSLMNVSAIVATIAGLLWNWRASGVRESWT